MIARLVEVKRVLDSIVTDVLAFPVESAPLSRLDPLVPPRPGANSCDGDGVEPSTFSGGVRGYIVWNTKLNRKILVDKSFSVDQNRAERRRRFFLKIPKLPGFFVTMDGDEHRRYRRYLAPYFTRAFVESRDKMIQDIVRKRLDDLSSTGGEPVDLVQAFCNPVPARVICEFLGVAPGASLFIQFLSNAMIANVLGLPGKLGASVCLFGCVMLTTVVPGGLASGGLAQEWRGSGKFSRRQLAGMVMLILAAGHETTANATSVSIVAALRAPSLRDALLEPDTAKVAVDELIRSTAVVQYVPRVAVSSTRVEDLDVRSGQLLCLALSDASHEGDRTPAANSRSLVFGHGLHHCIGQYLATATIRIALSELFQRFPDLCIVPGRPWHHRAPSIIYGLERLDVVLGPARPSGASTGVEAK